MKLNRYAIKDKTEWTAKGYNMPLYDIDQVIKKTTKEPSWIHFGAGNIFRAFPAVLQQKLLNEKKTDTGIILCETFDTEILQKAFTPFDNLSIAVTLKKTGLIDKEVVASITEAIGTDLVRLAEIFSAPSLQMATYTVTEKGYTLKDTDGSYTKLVLHDMENFHSPLSLMGISTYLAYRRFKAGAYPITFVSLDNYSHNGTVLFQALYEIATVWVSKGFVDKEFLEYLSNEKTVSFTWSMIDKITPRPDESVKNILKKDGLEDIDIFQTEKNTFSSVFVNAEETQYLVIEDKFPNGRPPLEDTGILFADREVIDKIEKMKVCTCLNPLHTALAVFGCLLGYPSIAETIKDPALLRLIRLIGYDESLPVVVSPGIIDPTAFIDEVINIRFPNPFIVDSPKRIVSDTSLKLPIRFGETLKAYLELFPDKIDELTGIPLVFAAWLRYLTALDDRAKPLYLSFDPRMEEMQEKIKGLALGQTKLPPAIKDIFTDKTIFGIDLYTTKLGEKCEKYLSAMLKDTGAVRQTLEQIIK